MGIRDRRGVSPVIATIIIVAIAIVMALAVAYWMLGLGGAFTRFEKLEFQSAYAEKDETNNEFKINMILKNTGSADATIDVVFLNGKPHKAYDGTDSETTITFTKDSQKFEFSENDEKPTIKPGEQITGEIKLPYGDDSVWKSGMTVEIMIQTVAGRQYPKSVILP